MKEQGSSRNNESKKKWQAEDWKRNKMKIKKHSYNKKKETKDRKKLIKRSRYKIRNKSKDRINQMKRNRQWNKSLRIDNPERNNKNETEINTQMMKEKQPKKKQTTKKRKKKENKK